MQNCIFLLLLVLPALAQNNDLPTVPPVGPNGPWVVTTASRGDYKATEAYTVNDLVLYNGDHYVSMTAENTGNEPTPVSSLWLRLPNYTGTIAYAAWGTTSSNPDSVNMKGKHFKSAASYQCDLASDLLRHPAPESPTPPEGKRQIPATKPKISNKSGEQFVITGAIPPAGYVCAGS